eukprot:6815993-Alexandrium_andersonii.AAC.1
MRLWLLVGHAERVPGQDSVPRVPLLQRPSKTCKTGSLKWQLIKLGPLRRLFYLGFGGRGAF